MTNFKDASILHMADLHIEDDPWTLGHLKKAASIILPILQAEKPSLIVIAGDYFHKNLPLDSEGTRFAIDFLRNLSFHAPILILEGTETHDRKSLDVLSSVQTSNPVTFVTEPSIVSFPGIPGLEDCDFYCMPGIKKKSFKPIAERYGLDLLKTSPGDLAAYQFQKWAEDQLCRPGRDAVFVGHIQLGLGGLEKMTTGYEPIISPATIEFIKPSLGLLGHVHDLISHGKYHYSGNLVPKTMIESEIVSISDDLQVKTERSAPRKGFYIHKRLPEGGTWQNVFHPVETVRFCQILVRAENEANLATKMEVAHQYLKTQGEGSDRGNVVCKFDVETPDPTVSDALFRQENIIRESMGKGMEIVSPSINVTSFSQHAARVEDESAWRKKDPRNKFFDWRARRGYERNEAEERELSDKIAMVL